MPPPLAPPTRTARVTRGRSKDADAQAVPPPESVASLPSQVTEEADREGESEELAEDAAIAQQLRGMPSRILFSWTQH